MVNSWRVQQAAREIRAGAVIAYPTEAVWGLGCDPWNEEAVDRLLAIKNRSVDKGLILVADNIRQFDFLFEDFPQDWIDRMASTWPGPNTWLVPHQDLLPEWVTGVHDTVALRVTDHPLVALLHAAPQTSEGLAIASGRTLSQVLATLTELELEGQVICEGGRWLARG